MEYPKLNCLRSPSRTCAELFGTTICRGCREMKPAAHDAAEDLILYGRAVINDKGELIHPMDEKTFIKN